MSDRLSFASRDKWPSSSRYLPFISAALFETQSEVQSMADDGKQTAVVKGGEISSRARMLLTAKEVETKRATQQLPSSSPTSFSKVHKMYLFGGELVALGYRS